MSGLVDSDEEEETPEVEEIESFPPLVQTRRRRRWDEGAAGTNVEESSKHFHTTTDLNNTDQPNCIITNTLLAGQCLRVSVDKVIIDGPLDPSVITLITNRLTCHCSIQECYNESLITDHH